jgi:SPP1 gp7 family putative phage head morphogenesis protein
LRQDLRRAPIGGRIRELLGEQVTFIRSIPTEAAQRVHELTIKGLEDSTRAKEYAAEIMRSGEVAKSRAILIARTETSRTATALTQTRAEAAGGTAYAWETVRDSSVRASHRAMQDQAVLWKAPPTLDGMTGHAGALPNCRCWPRVLLPE